MIFRSFSVIFFNFVLNLNSMFMNLLNIYKNSVRSEKKKRCRAFDLCSYCDEHKHEASCCSKFKCFNYDEIKHSIQSCSKSKKQYFYETFLINLSISEK